jgi:hypothetical protein
MKAAADGLRLWLILNENYDSLPVIMDGLRLCLIIFLDTLD